MRFAYQQELLSGPAPPSLPPGTQTRWRPLVPIEVVGPAGVSRSFPRAVVDPAADETVFPLDTARRIGARLLPDTGHGVRWRGQLHPLRFGSIELILTDGTSVWRWVAVVGFSQAPLRYPILGNGGCLQYIDAWFLGADLTVDLSTNRTYSGTAT